MQAVKCAELQGKEAKKVQPDKYNPFYLVPCNLSYLHHDSDDLYYFYTCFVSFRTKQHGVNKTGIQSELYPQARGLVGK